MNGDATAGLPSPGAARPPLPQGEGRVRAFSHRSFGQTMRPDVWWAQPLFIFVGLSSFIVYSTWAAFQGAHYHFGNYVSPFYSPEIFGDSPHAWIHGRPELVAGLDQFFTSVPDPVGARRISAYLLLL